MAKQKKNRGVSQETKPFWGRELNYVMSRTMYDDLTGDCKGEKMQAAIDYVNQMYNLRGHVTTLNIEDIKIQQTVPIDALE